MSAVELALQKVKALNETEALQLLHWLRSVHQAPVEAPPPLGARAMLGFARRLRPQPRSTADWMADLRAGEKP